MQLHRSSSWVLVPVALGLLGSGCTRATGFCQLDTDCAAGFTCSIPTSTCQPTTNTDLGPGPDLPGTPRLGTRLPAPSGSAIGDYFGSTVALGSGFAVLGAYLAKSGQGVVYTAELTGSTLGPYTPFSSVDMPVGYDYFGVSVAAYGNTMVIGASNKEAGKGAVYVYTRSGVTFSAPTKLVAADGVAGDYFGSAVSLFGDTLVVGAAYKGGTLGAAYVFTRGLTGVWSPSVRLPAPLEGVLLPGDYFGQQVAASTSYVAVAAPGRTLNTGAVYLYKFDPLGMVWKQTTPTGPLVPGSAPGEQLGSALAMSATTLAIGSAAYSPSPLVFAQGGVLVYSLETPGAPITLTLADPAPRDRFGAALHLIPPAAGLPEILLVGAPGRNQAFVYNNLEPWQRSAVLEVPLEGARAAVGSSVATTGTRHLLGTRGLAQEIGGAYFYSGN